MGGGSVLQMNDPTNNYQGGVEDNSPYAEDQRYELGKHHLDQLEKESCISEEIIKARGYCTVKGEVPLKDLEKRFTKGQFKLVPALAIPIYPLAQKEPDFWITRPDNPRTLYNKIVKYEYPKGISNRMDILPRFKEYLGDPSIDIWFTEGAKKADSLATAAIKSSKKILPVNLNGVWGWRSTNDKDGKTSLSDFENIALKGRRIVLAFDSDTFSKRQVMNGVSRLANYLAPKAAEISMLHLPNPQDEDKAGVDDFLSRLDPAFDPIEVLERHIKPFREAIPNFGESIGRHSVTGLELRLPAGYSGESGRLIYLNPYSQNPTPVEVFNGFITVFAVGKDYKTKKETLTIRFTTTPQDEEHEMEEVTAPAKELATGNGIIDHLTDKGAGVSEKEAKEVARFLVRFAKLNRNSLPRVNTTKHFGCTNQGIVGPNWHVGKDKEVYNGNLTIEIKEDKEAFRDALTQAFSWKDAWPLHLAIGFSVISPFIKMLEIRRNPVMWLVGNSNTGKSSACQFAISIYGNPMQAPLSIQATRTTIVGFLQNILNIRGLPLLIDDTQSRTQNESGNALITNIIYQFANQQGYSKGSKDGEMKGGEVFHCSVLMAGESDPEFQHVGAVNRCLMIDSIDFPPLGTKAKKGSTLGADRSKLLIKAFREGAGSWGKEITQGMWDNFESLQDELDQYVMVQEGDISDWSRALKAAALGTHQLLDVIEAPKSIYPDQGFLIEQAANCLKSTRELGDPSRRAFELIRARIINHEREIGDDHTSSDIKLIDRDKSFAIFKNDIWYFLHNSDVISKEFRDNIRKFGGDWLRRGWCLEGRKQGKIIADEWLEGKTQKCIKIPKSVIEGSDEG